MGRGGLLEELAALELDLLGLLLARARLLRVQEGVELPDLAVLRHDAREPAEELHGGLEIDGGLAAGCVLHVRSDRVDKDGENLLVLVALLQVQQTVVGSDNLQKIDQHILYGKTK